MHAVLCSLTVHGTKFHQILITAFVFQADKTSPLCVDFTSRNELTNKELTTKKIKVNDLIEQFSFCIQFVPRLLRNSLLLFQPLVRQIQFTHSHLFCLWSFLILSRHLTYILSSTINCIFSHKYHRIFSLILLHKVLYFLLRQPAKFLKSKSYQQIERKKSSLMRTNVCTRIARSWP